MNGDGIAIGPWLAVEKYLEHCKWLKGLSIRRSNLFARLEGIPLLKVTSIKLVICLLLSIT